MDSIPYTDDGDNENVPYNFTNDEIKLHSLFLIFSHTHLLTYLSEAFYEINILYLAPFLMLKN